MTVHQQLGLFPLAVASRRQSKEANITEMRAGWGITLPGIPGSPTLPVLPPKRTEMVTVKLCGENKPETGNILLQFSFLFFPFFLFSFLFLCVCVLF